MLGRLAGLCLAATLALVLMSRGAAQQGAGTTLRIIPTADLTILDPFGPHITRNHGYMV